MITTYVVISGVVLALLGLIWDRNTILNIFIKLTLLLLAAMAVYVVVTNKMLG